MFRDSQKDHITTRIQNFTNGELGVGWGVGGGGGGIRGAGAHKGNGGGRGEGPLERSREGPHNTVSSNKRWGRLEQ